MGVSRIEQLIEDIYDFIESCRPQALSQTKVVVPKDELYDLLDELRLRTPDEIKRYQKIIANRDAIMADAEKKALAIQDEARVKAKDLVNENEIMQQAYFQANELVQNASTQAESIMKSATEDADQIRAGALNYTNDILTEVDRILSVSYKETKERSEALVSSLKANLDQVKSNRGEIAEQLNPNNPAVYAYMNMDAGSTEEFSETDFEFDADTFLQDI